MSSVQKRLWTYLWLKAILKRGKEPASAKATILADGCVISTFLFFFKGLAGKEGMTTKLENEEKAMRWGRTRSRQRQKWWTSGGTSSNLHRIEIASFLPQGMVADID